MKFSVVIPTYNREVDLARCLTSVLAQDLLPVEVLVIDDGDLAPDYISGWLEKFAQRGINFRLIKKDFNVAPRGASQSWNMAMNLLHTEVSVNMDDDIVLEPGFFSELFSAWTAEDKLLGVGGVIINNRSKSRLELWYNRLFGLSSELDWDVTAVGYQVWNDQCAQTCRGHYAHGGLFAYRVAAWRDLGGLKEKTVGRNALEDVDLFVRAKLAGMHVYVEPKARAVHNQSPVSREKAFQTGKKHMQSRLEIYRSHVPKSLKNRVWFCWSTIGWIGRQFLCGHFRMGWGMMVGVLRKLEAGS